MPTAIATTSRSEALAGTGAASPWLWAALATALSASLFDLGRHWVEAPWARSSGVLLLLFAWIALREPAPRRAPGGMALVGAGLAVSLLAVGGGMPRLGRPGIALAALGMARLTGRPAGAPAFLALFTVPLPSSVLTRLSPGLESWVPQGTLLAAGAAPGAHVEWIHAGRLQLVAAGGELDLWAGDGGLALAWSLAALGWLLAMRSGSTLSGIAMRTALAALLALPVQACLLAAATAATLAGAAPGGRALLDHGPWGVVAIAAVLVMRAGPAHRQERR